MVHCILLAAGYSTRYGSNKLTAEVDGKQMFRHTADILQRLSDEGLCTLRIVTRPGLLPPVEIETVMNQHADEGIASSLRAGLLSLPDDDGPAAFFVADQPYLRESTIRGFLAYWQSCEHGILRCESEGVQGNPVIFDRRYFPELLSLRGDTGGRAVIREHLKDVALYSIQDRKELTDLDEKARG